MDVQTKLLIFAVDLFGPLLVGYLCKYQTRVGDRFFNNMILNNILVVCPIVSFLSFWVLPLTRDLLWLPLLTGALILLPGAIAYLRARHKYSDPREQGAYVMAGALSNLGTIGGVCVFLVYGERGYGYQQLVTMFQYVFMFLVCYPVAEYYEAKANGTSGKRVSVWSVIFSKKQLAVVGILFGGVLQCMGIPRPEMLNGVATIFVHMGAWTGLIPVGYSADFDKIRRYWTALSDLVCIKFVLTPVLIYGLSRLLIDNREMLGTLLILAATPTAINAVVTARLYHLSVDLNVAAFIVTTMLFMCIVYPAMFLFLVR